MSEVQALRAALAAEHAAVYLHGLLGGQAPEAAHPVLHAAIEAAYAEHRARRDELVARVVAAGGAPVAAEPAYEVPEDLSSPAAVAARARAVEDACAAAYAFLVGSSSGGTRGWAVAALTDAAVRTVGFGGVPEALPGT